MAPASVWRGEQVLLGDGLGPATLIVRGGRIEQVLAGLVDVPGAVVVEVPKDQVLMAGLVDSHVHINEPGRTDWEGFDTGTRAAAAGGVTTLVDMPLNSLPPTTTPANLATKVNAARGQCWVNVGFWGGVVPGNSGYLKEMVALGLPGFKCFLIHSGVDEFPSVSRQQAKEALLQLKGTTATLLFHAECEDDNQGHQDEASPPEGDPAEYSTFLASRPEGMETSAIQLVIEICRETGVPCHIVHLSAAAALPLLRSARAEGLPLTVETTHHYLSLTAEEVPERATEYKCCPPIRGKDNQEALWAAVLEGTIDMVVSDHSPCTPDLKLPGTSDFMAAWGGISSLQFGLALAWSQAEERGLTLPALHRLMSEAPAKLAGLEGRKGRLAAGYDADLVVWAPDQYQTVVEGGILHKNKLTPYLGRQLRGVVHSTVVCGREVYSLAGGFRGPPAGRLLLPGEDS